MKKIIGIIAAIGLASMVTGCVKTRRAYDFMPNNLHFEVDLNKDKIVDIAEIIIEEEHGDWFNARMDLQLSNTDGTYNSQNDVVQFYGANSIRAFFQDYDRDGDMDLIADLTYKKVGAFFIRTYTERYLAINNGKGIFSVIEDLGPVK